MSGVKIPSTFIAICTEYCSPGLRKNNRKTTFRGQVEQNFDATQRPIRAKHKNPESYFCPETDLRKNEKNCDKVLVKLLK